MASELFSIATSQRVTIWSSFNWIDYNKNKHPFPGYTTGLNERPGKALGFRTPASKLDECVALTG